MIRYWTPEPLFSGERVYVLGGGPSLNREDVGRLDPRRVIAVNTAAELAPDAALLFSRDSAWGLANVRLITGWSGLAVTTKRDVAMKTGAHLVTMERRDDFPPPGASAIRYGISSGHAAVSLALSMGAREIVLLGFDGRMVTVDGKRRSHWHDHYAEHRLDVYASFNRGWKGWRDAAMKHKCSILNATICSAITEFPFVSI